MYGWKGLSGCSLVPPGGRVKMQLLSVFVGFCGRNFNQKWLFKVGNMGRAISEINLMDKRAASKRTQVSAILCIKLLPLLENALKLNFKALY